MKKLLIILALVVLVVGGLTVPAFAGSEGVVSVTADVAQISVTVNPNSINYGLVPLNTAGLKPVGDPRITAYNTGNCFVDMFIRGADTTNWALKNTPGVEEYVHYFGWPFLAPTYNPLNNSYQDLGIWASYSPGAADAFFLKMDTPTTSSATGTQSTTVTVMVTYEAEGIKGIVEADGPYIENVSTTLTMTANVTDQNGAPVLGIPPSNFILVVFSTATPNWTFVPGLTATWNENGGGVYIGSIADISTLPAGPYFASIGVRDSTSHFAVAGDDFEIIP